MTFQYENGLLVGMVTPTKRVRFQYDNNGNLIEERTNDRIIKCYQYGGLSRLIRTENPRHIIVEYESLDSERILKTTTDIIARAIENDRIERLRIPYLDEILDEEELVQKMLLTLGQVH